MKTNGPSDEARAVLSLRTSTGCGIGDARRAYQIAQERFEGDVWLGYWWVHANALAVHVKGDRAVWNDAYARERVANPRPLT